MKDIVKRLRGEMPPSWFVGFGGNRFRPSELHLEAADEIERLREEIAALKILEQPPVGAM